MSDSENQKCLRLEGLENGRVLIFYSFCVCVSKTTQSVSFSKDYVRFSAPSEKVLNADFQSGKKHSQLIID